MTVSVVGFAILAVICVGLVTRRNLFPFALGASAALPTTAAITVGETTTVAPFYVLGVIALVLAIIKRGRQVPHPVWPVLALFVVVVFAVTVCGPSLFEGVRILLPRAGIDAQIIDPAPLKYTPSMVAQLAYLVIGVGVAVYLAKERATLAVLHAAFGVGIGLGFLRIIVESAGLVWPNGQFQNSATASYNPFETRFFGTFAEPSNLAVFAVAAATFYAFRLVDSMRYRWVSGVMLALALWQLLLASSGTAALAAVVIVVSVLAVQFWRFVFGRGGLHPGLVVGMAPLVGTIWLAGFADAFLLEITEKFDTESAANRFASDIFSLKLVGETLGIGVGLGANRPSSFVTMLLSCTGVVGATLFILVMTRTLRGRFSSASTRAAAWAWLALLIAKSLAEPALSTPLIWLTMGVLIAGSLDATHSNRPVDCTSDGAGQKLMVTSVDHSVRRGSRPGFREQSESGPGFASGVDTSLSPDGPIQNAGAPLRRRDPRPWVGTPAQ
ncbi:hypothetical protein [Nocardioides pantholopis]|uniref:hypothetical protein n=1 Tax=Nocardioides pantholopis TaxID=2483798 RepID=UPI0013DD9710|nr:hypothetical protein [Nocardioides pantholopis]